MEGCLRLLPGTGHRLGSSLCICGILLYCFYAIRAPNPPGKPLLISITNGLQHHHKVHLLGGNHSWTPIWL